MCLGIEAILALSVEALSLQTILAISVEALSLKSIKALSLKAILALLFESVKSVTLKAKLGDQFFIDNWFQQFIQNLSIESDDETCEFGDERIHVEKEE